VLRDEKTKVLIMAGGMGEGLTVLTTHRAIAAVPFAARYRLIDFPLSNCVNSGLYDIGILAQYHPISLMDHLGSGRAWDLDRKYTGLRLLQPVQTDADNTWYRGTANALKQNTAVFRDHDYVLVLPGDIVYKMDYRGLIRQHRRRRAAVTIATAIIDFRDAERYGIVEVAEDDRIVSFKEKPTASEGTVASMAVYLFDANYLRHHLEELGPEQNDLVRDLIIPAVQEGVVHQYPFNGYWSDVDELYNYYKANMELLSARPRLDIEDARFPVMTPTDEMPPAKFGPDSHVVRSLVANGSIVNGKVINSIISRGVYVEEGALVRDSILLGDIKVRGGAAVDRSIVDKHCVVGAGVRLGHGEVGGPNESHPAWVTGGITVVGKNVELPDGVTVGRHVCISPDTPAESLADGVESGRTVGEVKHR
jgi:glucose-1-phosphate adenylyltransferase